MEKEIMRSWLDPVGQCHTHVDIHTCVYAYILHLYTHAAVGESYQFVCRDTQKYISDF